MERSRGGFNILNLGRWLFLAFLLAFTALPMLWMVSTSIKTEFAAISAATDLDTGGTDAEPLHDAA